MDGASVLILLCVVMLIGSYVAGMIPLVVQLEEKLKKVSIFGAGLLVGTALTVIIPEGIRAIYSDCHTKEHGTALNHLANESAKAPDHPHNEGQELMIGLTLILGFIFMLIIDQVTHSLQRTQTTGISNERPNFFFFKGCLLIKRCLATLLSTDEEQSTGGGLTVTVGLVVHAAADGVALGAAASTQHNDVEFIVFLAIMLHKAPAAFGLVTFLLHEGVTRRQIRKNLLLFAFAAPIMTLVTFFLLGNEQKARLDSGNGTGMAMLFSAGTFLYVSTVHVLPELSLQKRKIMLPGYPPAQMMSSGRHDDGGDGSSENEVLLEGSSTSESAMDKTTINMDSEKYITITEQRHFSNTELLLLICGALMPLLLTMGGHHH